MYQEIPAEELRVSDNEKIIDVFHYHKDPARWHGVPFRFAIRAVSSSQSRPRKLLTSSCDGIRANNSVTPRNASKRG